MIQMEALEEAVMEAQALGERFVRIGLAIQREARTANQRITDARTPPRAPAAIRRIAKVAA